MDKNVTDFNVRLRTIKIRELIAGLVITTILSFILMSVFPVLEGSDDLFFIVFLLIGALLFVWALRGTSGLDKNFENLFTPENKKEIFYVFLTNILFAFLITFLISYLDILVGMSDPSWISLWDIETVDTDSGVIILEAIGTIIFAPVMEELIFRGVLFNRLKIRTGIIPAMLISSFIFAVGHDFGGIISAFLFGICMCILYLKTDNILVPMSVHFINNVVATVLSVTGLDVMISQLPWIIPSTVVAVVGSIYLIKYIAWELKSVKKQFN